jgi:hypothetical protein
VTKTDDRGCVVCGYFRARPDWPLCGDCNLNLVVVGLLALFIAALVIW